MQRTVIDDRYTLVELLGSGGMAQVYLAHDEVLDRDVALKILRGPYAEDEEFVERFRLEARSAAGLSHPNIVFVYDQGRSEDGAYYIAMEYVPRGTLKDRIRRDGALAPKAAVGIALQIADALQAAHEKGVIHRDIKPQNILVTQTGDVKVTDFGIARAASATKVTRTGDVLGTAGYMSPEQAKGETVGPRSDLYSLGVVLYEMLTGNLPYKADSPLAQAMKHVNEPPSSPREANPEVSGALDALTMKLLAKKPEDRYLSAAALANDLEQVRSGLSPIVAGAEKTEIMTTPLPPNPEGRTRRVTVQPPIASPVRIPEPGVKRRGRLLPALATLLLTLTVLGGIVWAPQHFALLGSEDSENQPDNSTSSIVEVPDLYWSMTAEADLANVGLKLGVRNVEASDNVPANVVIRSNPAEGDKVERDTVVDIWVSTGPAPVPVQNASVPQVPPAQPQTAQPQAAQPQIAQPAQPQFGGDSGNGEGERDKKENEKQREKGKGKGKGEE